MLLSGCYGKFALATAITHSWCAFIDFDNRKLHVGFLVTLPLDKRLHDSYWSPTTDVEEPFIVEMVKSHCDLEHCESMIAQCLHIRQLSWPEYVL